MRPRAQKYRTLDGQTMERDKVPWYWRLLATLSTLMILGGFLMLPATFDNDPKLKISTTALGIFGVSILFVGLACTGVVANAVRNPFFQCESIFQPALLSCAVGLLTVLYDFIISSRYVWNTKSLLIVIAASLSTLVYMGLLIWTYRRIANGKARVPLSMQADPSQPNESIATGSTTNLYQEPGYYQNYVQNMFPTTFHRPPMPNQNVHHNPQSSYQDSNSNLNRGGITEDEMQRQQMLMLLFKQDQPVTPEQNSSTYRLEWQSSEQDEPPPREYYELPPGTPPGSALPMAGLSRQFTQRQLLQPWDGVWRSPVPAGPVSGEMSPALPNHRLSQDQRDQRRRDIEMGW